MDRETLKVKVLESAKNHLNDFKKINQTFEDRGILNSEMLAVCGLSEDLGIEILIESGRWKGQSTEVLAHYFQGKSTHIDSVELYRDENASHVEAKMKGYDNLTLHYGDANFLVPALAKKYKNKKIAILFDGPKGQEALDIFQYSLTQSENIVAGFFHDMRKSNVGMETNSRGEMEQMFPCSFYTDDAIFVEEFSSLDANCAEFLWRPYEIGGKKIGSYGPTIGLVLPSSADVKIAKRKKMSLLVGMTKRHAFYLAIKIYHLIRKVFGH